VLRLAGDRIDDEFEDEAGRCEGEHACQHKEDVAPAQQIAEHAAGGLTEQLPENLARQIACQDRLQPVARRHVADIGHRDRDDPAGGRAGRESRQSELR
jgi:hypothetical protein